MTVDLLGIYLAILSVFSGAIFSLIKDLMIQFIYIYIEYIIFLYFYLFY